VTDDLIVPMSTKTMEKHDFINLFIKVLYTRRQFSVRRLRLVKSPSGHFAYKPSVVIDWAVDTTDLGSQ